MVTAMQHPLPTLRFNRTYIDTGVFENHACEGLTSAVFATRKFLALPSALDTLHIKFREFFGVDDVFKILIHVGSYFCP